jgi:hypothetical protein
MVSILGGTSGAAFLALTPAMTALMGIPILGELPLAIDWIAIVVISIGVYVVSGGPLPGQFMRPQFYQRDEDGPLALDRIKARETTDQRVPFGAKADRSNTSGTSSELRSTK